KELITTQLGHLVFGEEDQELEHIVVDLLNRREETLATLELGTGGSLANRIHEYPESSSCFAGGLIYPDFARAIQSLERLGTSSISQQTSLIELAQITRDLLKTDYLLMISDWDRNGGDQNELIPEVTIALIARDTVVERKLKLGGDPGIHKGRIGKAILNELRLHLLGVSSDEP
ncbi:MAG: CinA family protein, partial [Planctomycetaceae bacterium]|nr:CinA family protein [Planctomycetaceae bacterium]